MFVMCSALKSREGSGTWQMPIKTTRAEWTAASLEYDHFGFANSCPEQQFPRRLQENEAMIATQTGQCCNSNSENAHAVIARELDGNSLASSDGAIAAALHRRALMTARGAYDQAVFTRFTGSKPMDSGGSAADSACSKGAIKNWRMEQDQAGFDKCWGRPPSRHGIPTPANDYIRGL
eukprot:NODE_4843_length_1840_cov_4.016346.p2 GENE.NODE_4843_length_1840_cov_4.016346~~NODE_4843_length_1840_cov_4.016346.p2  ORF type:complete len:178 (-),score=4.78 NODE_4843_length_1840_cov_4.016346:601-1134(-)